MYKTVFKACFHYLAFQSKKSTMKKLIFIIAMLFVISIISVSCEKDEDTTTEKSTPSGY